MTVYNKTSSPPSCRATLYNTAYEAARWLYNLPKRALYRCSFDEVKVAPITGEIRMNYGRVASTPERNAPIIGGKVKLIHLRERFPENLTDFNCIYIVSSALPEYAEELVRWAKQRGCKFVLNQNGVAYRSWCGDYFPWFNKPMRNLLLLADYVVYQSEFCQEYADHYLAPTSVPHRILFNPVNIHRFCPPAELPPLSQWELLAAGTNHHFYRVQASLDCLALLLAQGIAARLTIAGAFVWEGGPEEVEAYLKKKNLTAHVRMLPPFTQDEAPAIYQNAHVLLHPKYKDPCPTVPMEAMACGLPVIGSRSGGMPELVPPQAGILIEVPEDHDRDHGPDPVAMAEAVQKIMKDHARFSADARAHASAAFNREAWLDAHEEVFRQVKA